MTAGANATHPCTAVGPAGLAVTQGLARRTTTFLARLLELASAARTAAAIGTAGFALAERLAIIQHADTSSADGRSAARTAAATAAVCATLSQAAVRPTAAVASISTAVLVLVFLSPIPHSRTVVRPVDESVAVGVGLRWVESEERLVLVGEAVPVTVSGRGADLRYARADADMLVTAVRRASHLVLLELSASAAVPVTTEATVEWTGLPALSTFAFAVAAARRTVGRTPFRAVLSGFAHTVSTDESRAVLGAGMGGLALV